MRILLVNKFYYLRGGVERYVQLWSRMLRERGHQVIPFAMSDPHNWPTPFSRYFPPQVSFDRPLTSLRSVYSFEARRRVAELVRRHEPQAAHVQSYCYQLTASIFAPLRRAGIPVIQTAHEYHHVCANQRLYNQRTDTVCERCFAASWYAPIFARCIKGSSAAGAVGCLEKLADRLLGLSQRGIDRVIAPSNFLRRKMIEFGWMPSRVVHVPNPAPLEDFDARCAPGPYFLYAGRLVRHKGVLTLIRAMDALPEARLIVAGDGPLRAPVEQAARSRANVKIVGFRDGVELRGLMERCLAAVVPSEWYENQPFAVLEAMAAGRAVVASEIGGMGELVTDGETGFLFPAGDTDALVEKLRLLWHDRGRAAEMGRAAREAAETGFSPQTHYEKVVSLLRCLA